MREDLQKFLSQAGYQNLIVKRGRKVLGKGQYQELAGAKGWLAVGGYQFREDSIKSLDSSQKIIRLK